MTDMLKPLKYLNPSKKMFCTLVEYKVLTILLLAQKSTSDNVTFTELLNEYQLESNFSESEKDCFLERRLTSDLTVVDDFDDLHCNATWDKTYCWPATPAGTQITRPCSEALKNLHPEYARHLKGDAIRICLKNGTWSQGVKTDYRICAESYDTWADNMENSKYIYQFVRKMVFVGSILSLLFLATALAILLKFKRLWSQRTKVHVHVMSALVLRFVLLFVITIYF